MTLVMTVVISSNRQVPRDALRARIYDAAIAEFRANGFACTAVEAITTRAKVAKGTFFNFYGSKADVLVEYYWTIDARLNPLRLALDANDPLGTLIEYVQAVEREFEREGDLIVDLIEETMRNDALRAMDEDSGGADAEQFAAFFERARAAGTVRSTLDPGIAAKLLIDIWAGSVRDWLVWNRSKPLAPIFEQRLLSLFSGLAPERKR